MENIPRWQMRGKMNFEYDLPSQEVCSWAQRSLQDSLALSFSHNVAGRNDICNGTFRVLAQEGLPKSDLLDFRHGGKIGDGEKPKDWLIRSLEAIRSASQSFMLLEDWSVKPGASFLKDYRMPAVYRNDEVYYVVEDMRLKQVPHWGRIISNTVPLFHGFVLQGPPPFNIGDRLTDATLLSLVHEVIVIVFGVYDGESYLLCSLKPSEVI